MKRFFLPLLLVLAAPATAETFDVSLGGKSLGTMLFAQSGTKATLQSTLDNTPMGVFNGTFTGTSTGSTASATFVGDSASSRKRRVVTVDIAKGRAVRTDITPIEEVTPLSDTSLVPANVIDPVRTIGALIGAGGCPDAMQMYDGRRVVRFSPEDQRSTGEMLTCTMVYRVINGPGHLSPLGIKTAKVQLSYTTGNGAQRLQQIKVSSGIFKLSLDRTN